jgi:voltage-gated potassium channel
MTNPLLAFWQRLFDVEGEARERHRAGHPVTPASPGRATSTIFLVLRRMRAPLVALIVIYAVAVLGLVLIPGQDADGNPWRMDFFHAFYFMSFTATTIGFGEIPHAFTDAQRLWVTFAIYLTVIGWAWAIGTLLALTQDRGFRQALAFGRFGRRVRALPEPFVLIAGFGATGKRLARSLDALGRRCVVVDIAQEPIDELALESFRADVPGLVADARSPQTLLLAGLTAERCEAAIALTNDDEANLAVAMAGGLLRPELLVIARTISRSVAERMRAFGANEVINPFDMFGDYLRVALRTPASLRLMEWLTSPPGSTLPRRREPPRGRWVVCGFGRFGREITADLRAEGLDVTVIEPAAIAADDPQIILGHGTEPSVLAQARLESAVGLVAATDNDTANLSIIATARNANPELFLIARQNDAANAPLFRAIDLDFALIPSQVIAQEVLARITSPLLFRFLALVPAQGEAKSAALIGRLTARCGELVPALWRVPIAAQTTPAVARWLGGSRQLALGDFLRDPGDRARSIAAVALLVVRADDTAEFAPADDATLRIGDQLLLAGLPAARRALEATCQSDAMRDYVLLGRDVPSGWLWQRIERPAR